MSLQKEPSGRRFVQVEVEVPGTPEQVWEAIATGPGVSSWFVPAQVEPRVGGQVTSNFGPGMESHATVTKWDPPHSFAAESPDLGPNAPPLATEWTVEAREGGKCIVRVVHSLFASTDDWDDQLSNFESGWPSFFLILRSYLRHFRGMPTASFRVMGMAPDPAHSAWNRLLNALDLADRTAEDRVQAPTTAPVFSGVVEVRRLDTHPHMLIRLDKPAPGIAFLNAFEMGGQSCVVLAAFLYGDEAAAVARQEEPAWHAWMKTGFPPPF